MNSFKVYFQQTNNFQQSKMFIQMGTVINFKNFMVDIIHCKERIGDKKYN